MNTSPQPHHTPPISRQHQPKFHNDAHRQHTAEAFQAEMDHYHAVRPSYPQHVIKQLLEDAPPHSATDMRLIVDLGCGSGKLTEVISAVDATARIIGIDPSAQMLHQLTQHCPTSTPLQATAEAIPLATDSATLITCAQTWHWVHAEQASREAARVATQDATLLLAWNTIDVTQPWAHRLTRIMHSGDTLQAGFYPTVTAPWRLHHEWREHFTQALHPSQVHQLMHTRSYWLRANAKTRQRMTDNLNWYLHEHLGIANDADAVVEIPYRFDAFAYRI